MTTIDYKTGDNAAENKIVKSAPAKEFRITFAMAEASGVTEAGLKAALTEKIGATYVEIEDMSGNEPTLTLPLKVLPKEDKSQRSTRIQANTNIDGCGQAFSAIIVSPEFTEKTTLARHRLVNSALKAEIAAIHAWTPKCYTPEQWQEQGPGTVAPGKATTGEVVTGTTA
jgi:stress-induced morphogen